MSYTEKNGSNFNKRVIRQIILDSCKHLRNKKGITCLTLPNIYEEFENELLRIFNVKTIHCYEKSRKVYEKIKDKYVGTKKLYNLDVFESKNQEYSICWLDLTVFMRDEIVDKLKFFINNNSFVKESIISITVTRGFRNKNCPSDEEYVNIKFPNKVLSVLPKGSKLIRYDCYYNNRSYMYNYIFKIN